MNVALKNMSKIFLLSLMIIAPINAHEHHEGCNHNHADDNQEMSHNVPANNQQQADDMNKMLEELLAGLLMQQQGTAPTGAGDQPMPGNGGMPNIDPDSLLKLASQIFNQHREEALRRKRELLEILPENIKLAVISACESYEDVAERINMCATLQIIVETVLVGLGNAGKAGTFTGSDFDTLIVDIQKLYQSLISGGFTKIIQGIPQSQDLPMPINPLDLNSMATAVGGALQSFDFKSQQSEQLTLEAITSLHEKLAFLLTAYPEALDDNLQKNILVLHDILAAVATQKVDVIAKTYLKFILVLLDETESDLQEAVTLLKNAMNERGIDHKNEKYTITNFGTLGKASHESSENNIVGDERLDYALAIWFKDLKRYKNTISVFKSLESSVKPGQKPKTSLFRALSYSYDFVRDMYDIYGQDTHSIGLFNSSNNFFKYKVPVALTDWMLRAGMAGWYYSDMSAEHTKGVMLNAVTGSLKLKDLSPMQQLIYKFAAVPLALPILFKPSFWFKQPNQVLVATRKTLASWVYYHVIYRHLRNQVYQSSTGQNVPLLSGEGTLEDHGDHQHRIIKLWDENYDHTKIAIIKGVSEINKVLCKHIHEEIRGKIDPAVLYKIHQYTWGIIKPEMIGHLTNAFLPLFFLTKPAGLGHVVNCDNEDVYGTRWVRWVEANRVGWGVDFNENAFYIEQQMLGYIFGSFGNFWGNRIATNHRTKILNVLGKIGTFAVDCCEAIGLINQEQSEYVHDMKDELVADFDENLALLKMLIQGIFVPNSPSRQMIILQLRERDYLNEETQKDPIEVNKVMVEFALTRMSEAGVINYLDAATLANTYKEHPENTAWIVDKTVEVIKQSLFGQFGGHIGSLLMTEMFQLISWNVGPIYPHIRNAISR